MQDVMYIMLNIITFLLFFLGIEYEGEHDYWNGVMTFFASIMFLVLAFSCSTVETPYAIYNPTTGVIETGYQMYALGYWMILVYFVFWVASFFYFLDLIFHEKLLRMFKWMKE